ncbi:unnamed protein product [Protopolystoma xenopodis]|uniref:Uncharacterized protein n=1 Tax=Protopolystoma xenopodis TaxID=117903 RepID=A0A3S5BTF2_9PLAT|nr:unnamed protein product [Protopolystoma xenopodis]
MALLISERVGLIHQLSAAESRASSANELSIKLDSVQADLASEMEKARHRQKILKEELNSSSDQITELKSAKARQQDEIFRLEGLLAQAKEQLVAKDQEFTRTQEECDKKTKVEFENSSGRWTDENYPSLLKIGDKILNI